jgi:hypothetical protein
MVIGSDIVWSAQYANASSFNRVKRAEASKTASVSDAHFVKAFRPMHETVGGIAIVVIPDLLNAFEPIRTRLERPSKPTSVSELQCENAHFRIFSTDSGITTRSIGLDSNARSPISRTGIEEPLIETVPGIRTSVPES